MPGWSTSPAARQSGTRSPVRSLELLGLVIVSLAAVFWGFSVIEGKPGLQMEQYTLLLGFYGMASAMFVIPRFRADSSRLFDLPVFITLTALLEFGLVPLYRFFFQPEEGRDAYLADPGLLTQALFYVVLGMIAFWVGSTFMRSRGDATRNAGSGTFAGASSGENDSVLGWLGVIYLTSTAVRIYLLRSNLYAYNASIELHFQNLATVQVLLVMTQFATFALAIAAVEAYWHPHDQKRKILFYILFASECFWGLLSGMKASLIQDLLLVALISSVVQRRLRARWMVAPLLMLILIYPFNNQYRNLVRGEGMTVTSLDSAARVGSLALVNATEHTRSLSDWFGGGSVSSLNRLDLLRYVAGLVHYGPSADPLRTRDHWWMLPVYPFIPRLVWASKPLEDFGQKFSILLNADPNSCASPTYPGDAYLEFGVGGVVVCMLVLGIFCEWLTRLRNGTLSKRRLFLFAMMFLFTGDLEVDVFSFWTAIIKYLTILSLVAWFIYRQRRPSSRLLFRHRTLSAGGGST